MVKNRSVPVDIILPHIVYQDVARAVDWLTATFGFTEHYRYGTPDGPIQGAQLSLGDAWVMLEAVREGRATPTRLNQRTQYLTIFVSDVAAHCAAAKAAGAAIVEDLNETVYGERQYVARDLDGHHWLFSQHIRDVNPTEWGATVAGRSPF